MKKFINLFKNRLVLYFGLMIFLSLIPYFFCYFKAPLVNTYKIDFKLDSSNQLVISSNDYQVLKDFFVAERENEISTKGSSKKIDYSSLDISFLTNHSTIDESSDHYTLVVSKKCFTTKNSCKKYMKRILDNKALENNINITYLSNDVIYEDNKMDVIKIYFIGLLVSFIITTILFILLYNFKRDFYNESIIYDNKNLYRTVFHKTYWTSQNKIYKKLKYLTSYSVLLALMLTMKLIKIPSGFSNLGLGFSYLVFSVISWVYGPICGLVTGLVSDIFGFIISPSPYGFFFPYTLSAMITGFIYGICFYKKNISYTKCLISRLFVNLFVNVILGSIWWAWLTGLDFNGFRTYLMVNELPKNLFYLLPQSILQFVILKALSVPLSQSNLISHEELEAIKVI